MVGEDAHGRGVAGAEGQVQVSDLRQQVEIAAGHALQALLDSAAEREREGEGDRERIIKVCIHPRCQCICVISVTIMLF